MFGLPHSFGENVQPCITASGEYCDAWDIMSAMNAFSYPDSFQGVNGTFGPGLNTFNLKALGGLPRDHEFVIDKPDISDTFDLAPPAADCWSICGRDSPSGRIDLHDRVPA